MQQKLVQLKNSHPNNDNILQNLNISKQPYFLKRNYQFFEEVKLTKLFSYRFQKPFILKFMKLFSLIFSTPKAV